MPNGASNAGAFIGNTYYYARGDLREDQHADTIYAIKDVDKFEPTFQGRDDVVVRIKTSLFGYHAVLDLAPVDEAGVDVFADGDNATGAYLVGVARHKKFDTKPRLLVAKVDPTTRLVDKYGARAGRMLTTTSPRRRRDHPAASTRPHRGVDAMPPRRRRDRRLDSGPGRHATSCGHAASPASGENVDRLSAKTKA